jgi:hypothetical protein
MAHRMNVTPAIGAIEGRASEGPNHGDARVGASFHRVRCTRTRYLQITPPAANGAQ